ncbi:MAG: hypothetical protein K0V04_15065 [Deltaproteobacteria bacterium]|nr:hypothetical protein [Deltaproteobacteria bacterium]
MTDYATKPLRVEDLERVTREHLAPPGVARCSWIAEPTGRDLDDTGGRRTGFDAARSR